MIHYHIDSRSDTPTMIDLFSSQLRQRQNRFTIKLIHYNLIHYSHFNCSRMKSQYSPRSSLDAKQTPVSFFFFLFSFFRFLYWISFMVSSFSGLLRHFTDLCIQPYHFFEGNSIVHAKAVILPHTLEFRSQSSTRRGPRMRHISDSLIASWVSNSLEQNKTSPPLRVPEVLRLPVKEQVALKCEGQSCSP